MRKYNLYFAWVVTLVATLGSLYWSEMLQMEPCTLCWYQRIFLFPLVLILGISAYKKDARIIPYALTLSSAGALVALYHIFLQKKAIAPHCKCTDAGLLYFGWMTPAMLSLGAFVLISALLLFARKKK